MKKNKVAADEGEEDTKKQCCVDWRVTDCGMGWWAKDLYAFIPESGESCMACDCE